MDVAEQLHSLEYDGGGRAEVVLAARQYKIIGRRPQAEQQQPEEISLLKCYDSIADGKMSRWTFHTACIDPTVPLDAPCRKNIVVRSYIFF